MNDLIAGALVTQLKLMNKNLDCIIKELKLMSRGDLK